MSDDVPPAERPTGGEADDTLTLRFDWTEVSPSVAVVETLAAASHRDPTVIPPLYTVFDTDALDALVHGDRFDGRRPGELSVSFVVMGFDVTVDAAGTVSVRSRHDRPGRPPA